MSTYPKCDICSDTGWDRETCRYCSGSGEGNYDGSTCGVCDGTGEELIRCSCKEGENCGE